MAYCSRCGNLVREGARFCDRCGASLSIGYQVAFPTGPTATTTYDWGPQRKDPCIAVILSILLPGLGQIYVGRVFRGVLILLLMPLFYAMLALPMYLVVTAGDLDGFLIGNVVIMVVAVIVYIWQIVDAHRVAEEHNRRGLPGRH
jgi:TM2 domain-containing membrane protein YozV